MQPVVVEKWCCLSPDVDPCTASCRQIRADRSVHMCQNTSYFCRMVMNMARRAALPVSGGSLVAAQRLCKPYANRTSPLPVAGEPVAYAGVFVVCHRSCRLERARALASMSMCLGPAEAWQTQTTSQLMTYYWTPSYVSLTLSLF
eukprot:GHUV01033783.1.p1 GENE.GHUV01033783.1~~GHUV01033783.1.p1  ORF type:complete len:145 (-),score=14.33 GHUV01033783.1:545-979(-)